MKSLAIGGLLWAAAGVLAGPPRLPSSAFVVPGTDATYDYVVIGGGTAGLAIASRLATQFSVAVVEAGGVYEIDNGNQSVVPYYSLVLPVTATTEVYPRQPLVDWDLVSTPQTGAANRRIHYARGKTLGGSSALNTMAYLRATIGTHQWWADLVGDTSYRWLNVLPFFRRSCTLTPPNAVKRNDPNATVNFDPLACGLPTVGPGPLQVSWGNWVDPTISWLAKALQGIGMPLSPVGQNSGVLSGFGAWVSSTIDPQDATRSSSETSYLRRAIVATGLRVYPHTQATKILFTAGKATGVTVNTAGLVYTLSATKEVIVSAGVFHSPQLLMVSGIGPSAALTAQGIPIVKNLPGVGQNLWDQPSFNILQGITTPSSGAFVNDPDPVVQQTILRQYLDEQAGPYSSAGGYFSFEKIPAALRAGFTNATKTKLSQFPGDWPEVEYVVFGFPFGPGVNVGVVSATLTAPLSRGSVTISSASMADPPVIDLGWLTDPADAEVAVAAFKRCRAAWASSAIDPVRAGPEIVPGAAVTTDAQILDYIRGSLSTVWHASATCKMGKATDSMAVVDSHARVFGVTGLRVVDASVFPFAVPPNPQGTVYMLAEKIADAILNGQ